MFCPVCSQQQVGNDTRFCSRCGFLLIGVSRLIENGGALPQALVKSAPLKMSERKKGLKQGALLTLSSFIIVPVLAVISVALHANPSLIAIVAIITFWGGILRMLYALLFESNKVEAQDENILPAFIRRKKLSDKKAFEFSSPENFADSSYDPPAISWRDTNDLAIPPSVTEETTKLFSKNKQKF